MSQHKTIKDEYGNLLDSTTFTIGGDEYTEYTGSLFTYSGSTVTLIGDQYNKNTTVYTRGSATSGYTQGSPCNLDLYTKSSGTTKKSAQFKITYTPQGSLYPAANSGQNLYLGSTTASTLYALQGSDTYMYAPTKTFTTGAGNKSAYRSDLLFYWDSYNSKFTPISTDSSLIVGCLQTLDSASLVYSFLNKYGFIAASANKVGIKLYREGSSTTVTETGYVDVDNYAPYGEDLYYEGESTYEYSEVSTALYKKGDTIPGYKVYSGDTLYTASGSSTAGKTYTFKPATFATKTVTAVTKKT